MMSLDPSSFSVQGVCAILSRSSKSVDLMYVT